MSNKIEKVSDLEVENVAEYLMIDYIDKDEQSYRTIETALLVATSFIEGYTGLTKEEMDKYPDLIEVVLILCQDMYDNRSLYIDNSNLNLAVQSILNLHDRNLM